MPLACCQPQALAFAESAGAAVQLWLGLGLGVTVWLQRLAARREPEAHVQIVHLSLQQLAVEQLSALELACEEQVRIYVEAQHPPACVIQVVRHAAACLAQLRVVPEQLVFHPTHVAAVLVGHFSG